MSGVTTPLHDDEPDIDLAVVRTLLRRQVPELADLPLAPLSGTGSDNALYRLDAGFVVRLRRFADAAERLGVELDWLPRLTGLPVAVPSIAHVGSPAGIHPFRWALLRWVEGTTPGTRATERAGSAPGSGTTWPGSSSSCGARRWEAHLLVDRVSGADRSDRSTTACAGGSTRPEGSSTPVRCSGCGTSAWRAPTTA